MVHERYKKIVYEDEAMLDQRHAATNANVILLVFLGCLEFWVVLAYSLLLALVTPLPSLAPLRLHSRRESLGLEEGTLLKRPHSRYEKKVDKVAI